MADAGLRIVENPSAALLAERQNADGSVVLATLEGTRPLPRRNSGPVSPTNFGYLNARLAGLI